MKILVRLKSFEEIASVSVPTIILEERRYSIVLENLAYKNFNNMNGKYKYNPKYMASLHNKDIVVETDRYEDCYLYEGIKLGGWMINLIKEMK